MRPALAAFLSRLPFNPRSKRAIDEALCDWRHEERAATAPMERLAVIVRSIAGVTRAIVGSICSEIAGIPCAWLVRQLAWPVVVPAVVLAWFGWGHIPHIPPPAGLSSVQQLQLIGLLLPQAVVAALPLALFAVVSGPSRRADVPVFGLSAAAFMIVLAVTLWVLPATSRQFHVIALAPHASLARSVHANFTPPSDMTALDIVVAAAERPAGPAMAVVLFRIGMAVMASAFVLLGSATAFISARLRRPWVAGVAAVYFVGLALFPSEWELGGHAPAFVGLIPWCAAGGAVVGAIMLPGLRQSEGGLT